MMRYGYFDDKNKEFDIEVSNPKGISKGVKSLLVDGKRIEGNTLPVFKDKKIHKIKAVSKIQKRPLVVLNSAS